MYRVLDPPAETYYPLPRRISIDGHTEISFTEDVAARFVALGWHVQHVKDGNTDLAGLRAALDAAKADPRPSFIKARSLGLIQFCSVQLFVQALFLCPSVQKTHAPLPSYRDCL